MAEYRTKGIILRRRNIGEADRLYSILTLGKGKVTAKARGVRRVTSKQSGHLEPFYLSSFHLISSRQNEIVTQALVEEDFPSIHGSLEKIGLASRLVELIDRLTEDHQPVPTVYEHLYESLRIIESIDVDKLPSLFHRIFELKLMSELGYRPELEQCVVGEEKYSPIQSYQFSVSLGGIVCPDHQVRHPGVPVSSETIGVMRLIVCAPLSEALKLDVSEKTAKELGELIRRFLTYHLDPKLKSPKVAQDLQEKS